MCFRSMQIKMQGGILSEMDQAHHSHQNIAQEREKAENESPDELIVDKGTTHNLINGTFGRELSQNIVVSEINNHLPTKIFSLIHTETM